MIMKSEKYLFMRSETNHSQNSRFPKLKIEENRFLLFCDSFPTSISHGIIFIPRLPLINHIMYKINI